ncbi:MAG: hypothetical protein J6Y26_05685 [Lachnospiraceae bacterium]|nr:hypothetical protein [Lachnospiraceae bacterium]
MRYIQIGVTALRTPGGDFLPSVPLYAKAEDAAGISEPDKRCLFELGKMVEEYKKEAERLEAEAAAKKRARAEAKREARKKKRRSMYPFI